MSEKKTIQINPDLFRFSTTNKTRKKRNPANPVRIKSSAKPVSSKTIRNRLLKYIRRQQDDRTPKKVPPVSDESGFESDFEDSLKYLSSVAERTQNVVSPEYKHRNNATLRQLPPTTESLLYRSALNNPLFDPTVGLELPDVFNDIAPSRVDSPMSIHRPSPSPPKYGCLKNGALPTYRMWKNQTLRSPFGSGANAPSRMGGMIPNIAGTTTPRLNPIPIQQASIQPASIQHASPTPKYGGRGVDVSEMKKHHERKQQANGRPRPKNLVRPLKQKRTLRRTFHVGKSKHYPRVGVLVSNKTLRKQITTQSQLLKQTPMDEVKKTLIKKGFIKVGSTAPTDVLRKMYETVSLVCGDIQNHNPENLLYNYLNGRD